ncbi:MAG: hypothetical protein HQL05_06985 [Nitrospirae bacterium]|uniref:hypothetical protein n=1 Tax=Candidatus Magnetobacterium casense TaxID=1455061 RepID=UPI0012DDDA66|nr:hypothetical protein [Candidatus Magnetobacterium casensis]MBF0337564.1 hypothetical protein [Nitrospirota bacterium]
MQPSSDDVVKGIPTDWQVKAIADYNGDGKSDVSIYNTTTAKTVIWLMDGTKIIHADYTKPNSTSTSQSGPLTQHSSGTSTWELKSSGDYNGDGVSDMIWHNSSTGDVYMWIMDGSGNGYSGGWVDHGIPQNWSIY